MVHNIKQCWCVPAGKMLEQHGRKHRPMTQKLAPQPDPDAVPAPPEPRNVTPAASTPPSALPTEVCPSPPAPVAPLKTPPPLRSGPTCAPPRHVAVRLGCCAAPFDRPGSAPCTHARHLPPLTSPPPVLSSASPCGGQNLWKCDTQVQRRPAEWGAGGRPAGERRRAGGAAAAVPGRLEAAAHVGRRSVLQARRRKTAAEPQAPADAWRGPHRRAASLPPALVLAECCLARLPDLTNIIQFYCSNDF